MSTVCEGESFSVKIRLFVDSICRESGEKTFLVSTLAQHMPHLIKYLFSNFSFSSLFFPSHSYRNQSSFVGFIRFNATTSIHHWRSTASRRANRREERNFNSANLQPTRTSSLAACPTGIARSSPFSPCRVSSLSRDFVAPWEISSISTSRVSCLDDRKCDSHAISRWVGRSVI